MYLISACLAGVNCKYNGNNNYNEKAFELVKRGEAIPICPEQLGGLMTPRIPAEIRIINDNRRVINKNGEDVTAQFEKGANEVLQLCKKLNVDKVILQARSPSCGVGKIYSGDFDGTLIDGNGITAQLLIDNGIEVESL
ncbi:MAG: DUF523 domain-containing protein [Clostridia bacterium]|nr:DUF523 domain-containing protein [Clostridia bacterium]